MIRSEQSKNIMKHGIRIFIALILVFSQTLTALAADFAYEVIERADFSEMHAGKTYRGIFRLKNIGTETWDENVSLMSRWKDGAGGIISVQFSYPLRTKVKPGGEAVFSTMIPRLNRVGDFILENDLSHKQIGLFSESRNQKIMLKSFHVGESRSGIIPLFINTILIAGLIGVICFKLRKRFPVLKKIWKSVQYPVLSVGIFAVSRLILFFSFTLKYFWSANSTAGGQNILDLMVDRLVMAWDGGWYFSIIQNGYSFSQTGESSIVFYPLYPLLSYLTSLIPGVSPEMALLLVSNVAGVLAIIVIYHLFEHFTHSKKDALSGIMLLSFFPASLFMSVAYAESLFILFIALSLLLFVKYKKLVLSYIFASLALVTKVPGILLIPTYALLFIRKDRKWKIEWKQIFLLVVTIIPYGLFLMYSKIKFGYFFAPFIAQGAWHGRGLYNGVSNAIYKIQELFNLTFQDVFGNERILFNTFAVPDKIPIYELMAFAMLITIVFFIIRHWKKYHKITRIWGVILTLFFLALYYRSGMGFAGQWRFYLYFFPLFYGISFTDEHVRSIIIALSAAMLFMTGYLYYASNVYIV